MIFRQCVFLFPFRDTTFPYAPDEFLSDHVEVLFMRMSVLGRNINPVLSILPDKFYLRPRLLQEILRIDAGIVITKYAM